MSAPAPARPSRPVVAFLALGLLAAILVLDSLRSPAVDLFSAPPPIALGSGVAPGGAHCSGG
jgi:hypothetical protein